MYFISNYLGYSFNNRHLKTFINGYFSLLEHNVHHSGHFRPLKTLQFFIFNVQSVQINKIKAELAPSLM